MTMPFDTFLPRRGTDSLKWGLHGPDVLPLWVADMDFPAPEPVLEAMRERLSHGVLGYTALGMSTEAGAEGLREVLMERLSRLYGWEITAESLVFIPGVVTGFNLACHALGSSGDAVAVQPPVYTPFLHAPEQAGKVRRDVPLVPQPDGTWQVDWEAFEAAMAERPAAFLLCNPHNPLGRVWRPWELRRMAEACLRHGVTVISDEIHCDLLFDGHVHTPMAALDAEVARHTITLMAPSKTFNIAGLTCSFAVIPDPELRKRFLEARRGLVPWVNLMGIVAAEAAYRHGQPWLDGLLVALQDRRRQLEETLARDLAPLRMVRPEATYLAWIDCREVDLPPHPGGFFLERARVALIDGEAFGTGGRGYVRLNFGCAPTLLDEALTRMAEALHRR